MNPTERYLKAAMRGLWGRERRALRAELKGHIDTRVQEFRLGGLSEPEAERQTLRELGAPVRVSGGMLGVHTLPALGKAGALTALLMTGLLTVLPQGLAQVSGQFLKPDGMQAGSYLDFDQLRNELAQAGGTLTGPLQNAVLSIPSARGAAALDTTSWPGSSFAQGGHQYIETNTLLNGLLNTGADLTLSGWTNPTLQAAQSNIKVKSDDWRVISTLYFSSINAGGPELREGNVLSLLEPNGNTSTVNLNGNLKKGRVYALLVSGFGIGGWTMTTSGGQVLERGNIFVKASISQAETPSTMFRLDTDDQKFKFYPSVEAFQTALDPYRQKTPAFQWSAEHPAPALLLELSGHFGKDAYTVVDPAGIKGTASDH